MRGSCRHRKVVTDEVKQICPSSDLAYARPPSPQGEGLGERIPRRASLARDDRGSTIVRVGADAHIRPRADVVIGPYGMERDRAGQGSNEKHCIVHELSAATRRPAGASPRPTWCHSEEQRDEESPKVDRPEILRFAQDDRNVTIPGKARQERSVEVCRAKLEAGAARNS